MIAEVKLGPSKADTCALIGVLEALVVSHRTLLSLLQEEKTWVVAGKVDALMPCIRKKQETLNEIDRLEGERLSLIAGFDLKSTPTFKSLLPLVPDQYRDKLQGLAQTLSSLTDSIQEINQINGVLVQRVLGQISELFHLLQHLTEDTETYQPSGEMQSMVQGRSLGRG